MALRHRATLIGLEGETIYVEGPDDELADYYAQAPERWRGRFFIFKQWAPDGERDGERKVYEMSDAPPAEDGTPIVQWNRVTDPKVLESIR